MKRILQLCVLLFASSVFSQTVGLQTFASGFSSPVALVNAGDDRLFVVQRGGLIRIVNANGTINTTPFLSLTSIITAGGERGLLGLAFHPDYATNGRFYVNYTRSGDGATVIAKYTVSTTDPNVANSASAEILLTIAQPFSNHNGGSLNFGPDGYLYIGMGDGGSGGDPNGYGQNLNSLLGKMLRIDVDGETGYAIPADNPYVGIAGEDEIWAVGVRNPWKFSFDRLTGDIWIADVGQNAIEEINKATSTEAGLNYGWRCYEGNSAYNTSGCGASSNYTFPIAQYTHASTGGCSLTGGYVYRGTTYPALQNKYVFADYCNNKIGYIDVDGGPITWTANAFSGNVVSFGEDVNGELYWVGISNGVISRVIDTSLSTNDFQQNGLSLYPNPANNSFTIQNSNLLNLNELTIYDSMGKRVANQKMGNLELTTVAIDNLTSGLYFVSVEDVNGGSFTSKLVVK
ncbi:PQQ-dependent sugar dehydrogenase [Flavobacterium azooxidireducens]|uniref:PQQ-dependent sugar dehydrogenase n=1 Tax=Flavobacterium azooxidireducens TaxID=1871076 RepID=A0ABY4KHG0_9FLAO|nr:PQQ-dependent sugar dehydrogenase [Flavobacterium azooxidireducens]UPQ80236.1 PQQ-dependent sugar dehydrogenase [Flavobacterium azooxidireducens]